MPTDMPAIVTSITTTGVSLLGLFTTFPLNIFVIFAIVGAVIGVVGGVKHLARR